MRTEKEMMLLLDQEQRMAMGQLMSWGKYAGRKVSYVMQQDKYCTWMINQPDMKCHRLIYSLLITLHEDKLKYKPTKEEKEPEIFDKLKELKEAIDSTEIDTSSAPGIAKGYDWNNIDTTLSGQAVPMIPSFDYTDHRDTQFEGLLSKMMSGSMVQLNKKIRKGI